MAWTSHRERELQRRWVGGERASVIGQALGVSRSAVQLHRQGLLGGMTQAEKNRRMAEHWSSERRRLHSKMQRLWWAARRAAA